MNPDLPIPIDDSPDQRDAELRQGLLASPKRTPAALLYDDLGSALFEAITQLPHYRVAQSGLRLLTQHATELARHATQPDVIELGPGSGRHALVLLEAMARYHRPLRFLGIDISERALRTCRQTLRELPHLEVRTIRADFIAGLRRAMTEREPERPALVLLLGSSLSNFDRQEAPAFLRSIRDTLKPKDRLVLAADLDKRPEDLLLAYDDPLGVTAAFNKNVLLRLNREWSAAFDLSAFTHRARFDPEARRIEMHLVAQRPCEVPVRKLGLTLHFARGESLWTESSHRFSITELETWTTTAGFHLVTHWIDLEWPFVQMVVEVR